MIWRGIGVIAALAALGAVAGQVATADEAPATRTVRAGAATLTLAGEWRVLDANTLTNGRRRMHLTFGQPDDPSLLPPGVAASGAPKATRLGGYAAWAYGTVAVLPTTRGVLAVECACPGAVRSVSVAGAAMLAPAPDLALRLRAPSVLATLDATRVSARASWTATSAHRLAAAHRTALAALRPIVARAEGSPGARAAASPAAGSPGDRAAASPAAGSPGARAEGSPGSRTAASPAAGSSGALVIALSDAARAYDRFATTPDARGAVVAADRRVDAAVIALARAGAPAVQRPPASVARPAGGSVSTPTLVLILAVALLISALAPAAVRRLRERRASAPVTPAEPETRQCILARRRTPIAPPPTYGRWNEAPRGPGAAAARSDDDARAPVMASSWTA